MGAARTVRPSHRRRSPLCVHRDVKAVLWTGKAVVDVVASHGDAPFVAKLKDGARELYADAHLLAGLRAQVYLCLSQGRCICVCRCKCWIPGMPLSLQALTHSYRRASWRCGRRKLRAAALLCRVVGRAL